MNNISAVRYILSFSVIIAHVSELMGFDVYWPIQSYVAVGGFFALSGYLIFGSYERNPSLVDFLRRRARRIMPPYIAVVLVCAVGMVFFSSLTPIQYFSSPGWWSYLAANLSFLNFLAPTLPGVFQDYAEPAVNGSLWTMKVEWMLYLSVPIAAWMCSKWKCNRARMSVVIYLFSIAYRLLSQYLYQRTGNEIYMILSRQVFGQLAFFYTGVWVYSQYELFSNYRHQIGGICLLLFMAADYIPYYNHLLEPAVISLLVIYACTTGKWGTWVPVKGNISYEMYLWHCPIIQAFVSVGLPSLGFLPSLLTVTAITIIMVLAVNKFLSTR